MIQHTVIQDCLQLNWAVPEAYLPSLPAPLAYDRCKTADGDFVFVSALLFRQHGLGSEMRLPRVSYPQCQLHACARDGDGVACSWVFDVLLPGWLAPSVRWVAGRPARGARLDYPATGEPGVVGERWAWSVRRSALLEVEAKLASSPPGYGPSLGSWKETLAYFRRQRREYVSVRGRLRRFETERSSASVIPVAASLVEDGLLLEHLAGAPRPLPGLHSSWLLPAVDISFEYAVESEPAALPEAPAAL